MLIVPCVMLRNRHTMPSIGLGTFNMKDTRESVEEALKAEYRLLDCAWVYKNEKEVGEALASQMKKSKINRKEFFIISKLWNSKHHPKDVPTALKESLTNLGLNYIDLYLMHWPFAAQPTGNPYELLDMKEDTTVTIEQTWKAMENLVDTGLAKSIGVCNFNESQLERILKICRYHPVVNEVECNPYINQKPLIEFCNKHDIKIIGYAPFWSPESPWVDKTVPKVFDLPIVNEIAKKHNKSPGQIILRFLIQLGVTPIPKSDHTNRLIENIHVFDFELDKEDMRKMESIHTGRRSCPFLTAKNFKEYPFKDYKFDK